jgi:sialic acid synthase SpsE
MFNFKINKSKNNKCFIIGEAGINHDGSLAKAKKLIDVAVEARVDAVKFQLFQSKKLTSDDAFLATYHKKGLKNKNETIQNLLKRLELKKKHYIQLKEYAEKRKILIFATAFDVDHVNFLDKLGTQIFKIASFSLTNFKLIEHIARKKKATIISTGLHNLAEIENICNIFRGNNNNNFCLLQCTSHYPSEPKDANLLFMNTLRNAFESSVGYSDHTLGISVSLAAVALGATVIEKHYTLETNSFGVDHDASLNPTELKSLVQEIRNVELSMGTSRKIIPEIEKEIQRVHRPSLVSKIFIKKGTIIKSNMIDIKKPGTGINPLFIDWVIGRKTKKKILANKLICKDDLV